MPAEERDAAILERLREVMRYCWERAPFYRRKWTEAGVHPEAIRTLEDFERVPVVRKEDLRRAQAAHPPFGDYACVDESEVHRIHGTSGTTGRPTAFGVSRTDWRDLPHENARGLWALGLPPGETRFVGYCFTLCTVAWVGPVGI